MSNSSIYTSDFADPRHHEYKINFTERFEKHLSSIHVIFTLQLGMSPEWPIIDRAVSCNFSELRSSVLNLIEQGRGFDITSMMFTLTLVRHRLMCLAESKLAATNDWGSIRGKLLKHLGRNGLEGMITALKENGHE